jgi:hypothetical protein
MKRSDRGASAVVIGICLVFLIAFAGLAVDVGALYAERTELQKGAEAAVLAIAEDCAHGTKPCDVPTATATAEDYIAANATDLAGALDSLDLDLVAQEVTVIDATERSDGGSIFLPFFAQVIGWEGMTVKAQAIARWGTLASYNTIPITMSMCDIGYDPDTGTYTEGTITVRFLDPLSSDTCPGHPGFDTDGDGSMPAGFGTLYEESDCVAYTEAYDELTPEMWTFQNPGADFSEIRDCLTLNESYVIPVFVDYIFQTDDPCPDMRATNGITAQADCYGIGGYVHFTVTGWRFPGNTAGSPGCGAPDSCITGTITGYSTTGEIGESFNFGVVVVELIG